VDLRILWNTLVLGVLVGLAGTAIGFLFAFVQARLDVPLSDRVVVMNKGRIEQAASPADIYFRPATVFVAHFIGRANFIEVVTARVEADRAAVTALGRDMTIAAHPEVRANAATYLMVRPETLSLTAAPEGGIGSVLRATFHGHSVDYEVETGAGTLAVTVPGPDPQCLLAEGTNVTVGIDPARAYVLVKSGSPARRPAAWNGMERLSGVAHPSNHGEIP
ncbi:MAG TPA: TOBE domain-containing protein, partial [Nonomuraea sp.]|nr:TOBE domain-containing protein [Nonomuraea sp.]